ncbi:MAG: zf-TFIIB domain-containing protein [Thermoleophilia bacterium]
MTEKAATMKCPNADGVLRPVTLHSRLGQPILLDQCDGCGGVWFDGFELFQVDEAEASKIDQLDKEALRFPAGSQESPACPRCGAPLSAFHDPNIPSNIQLLICAKCEGLWANHGDLAGYTQSREKGRAKPDPKLAAEYDKMLESQSSRKYWEGMEGIARDIGGRRDFVTGLPLDGTPAQLARIDDIQDVTYTILGMVFRLLFGGL